MEEHGESYALALTLLDEDRAANEADDCEEALRLGLQLDEEDDAAAAKTEALDAEIARKVFSAEQMVAAADERLRGKVEASDTKLAQKIAGQQRAEADRIAKLEVRQQKLAEKLQMKEDTVAARNLLLEIEAEVRTPALPPPSQPLHQPRGAGRRRWRWSSRRAPTASWRASCARAKSAPSRCTRPW